MSFWNDERPMTGMRMPDVNKIACRFCGHAEKEHIARAHCKEYPEGVWKPKEVCFDNAPCPKFKEGEDLLPYEIQI